MKEIVRKEHDIDLDEGKYRRQGEYLKQDNIGRFQITKSPKISIIVSQREWKKKKTLEIQIILLARI